MRCAWRWIAVLAAVVPLWARASTRIPVHPLVAHIALDAALGVPSAPLADVFGPLRPVSVQRTSAWSAILGESLVLKPDLGSCKTFARACAEGGIISPTPMHPIRTLGAGVGVRVGGVRLEYARGLQTGTNFIGIRSRLP